MLEELPDILKEFVLNRLWSEEENFTEAVYTDLLYELHNVYVNPSQQANNRFCKSCIVKTRDACRAAFPQ